MIRGFVDLQVNGFAGVDFTSQELTGDKLEQVSRRLFQRGTIGYCPTVISCPPETYAHCLPILAAYHAPPGAARNLGLHLEGPFINPADGTRGVHPQQYVIPPSIDAFERLRELANDRIAILTLAPEMDGAIPLIEHIVENTQTKVSIGHSAGNSEDMLRAIRAGATLATHLGNGIADHIHRHRNTLWTILSDDRVAAMLVTDGFHLPEEFIRVAIRSKGLYRIIVTSDLVHIAGNRPGNYDFHGLDVVLEDSGHLHQKGAHQLAGSSCDMLDCMNYLASLGLLNESQLADAGMENALTWMGIQDLVIDGEPPVTFNGKSFQPVHPQPKSA